MTKRSFGIMIVLLLQNNSPLQGQNRMINYRKANQNELGAIMSLVVRTFTGEQGIPEELNYLPQEKEPRWYCAEENGHIIGAVAFFKAMKAEGIHPIIGCEVYVAPESRFIKSEQVTGGRKERAYYHLILLAKNNEGLVNLNRLVSKGYTEGFYRKPRIDEELLEQYHNGLICLSACMAGKIGSTILAGSEDDAERIALKYNDLFGQGNYYLEIQSNFLREQGTVNAALIKLSRNTGIPLIVNAMK